MPRRIGDYRGLTRLSRLRLLHEIQREPGRLLQDLAAAAGLHVNTAREHLRVLEDEGLITSEPVTTGVRGRPPVAYSPVTEALEGTVAARRVESAHRRGEVIRRVVPALDRTEELGIEATHQLDALQAHLDDVGFDPAVEDDGLTIGLTPCPYVEGLDEERGLVCAVHAELVRNQLGQVPGPLSLDRLLPFVEPGRCVLRLARDSDAATSDPDPDQDQDQDAAVRDGSPAPRSMPATTSAKAPTSTSSHRPSE